MIILKNFKSYTPKDVNMKDIVDMGIAFLKAESGEDWYQCQSDFYKSTTKVVFGDDGVITSLSEDVSQLWPIGQSVAEVETTSVPKDFSLNATWIFDIESSTIKNKVYSTEELKNQVSEKVRTEISSIMQKINPLQFAVDLEMATEEERNKLKALQKYVVLLNRVPLQESYPTGVNWPEIPTT